MANALVSLHGRLPQHRLLLSRILMPLPRLINTLIRLRLIVLLLLQLIILNTTRPRAHISSHTHPAPQNSPLFRRRLLRHLYTVMPSSSCRRNILTSTAAITSKRLLPRCKITVSSNSSSSNLCHRRILLPTTSTLRETRL